MALYKQSFYAERDASTRYSADTVLARPLPLVHPAHFTRKTTFTTRKALLLAATCFGRFVRRRVAALAGLIRGSRA
jgi:hypothetical protein